MKRLFIIAYFLMGISIQMNLFNIVTSEIVFSENEISIKNYDPKIHDDPDVIYKSPDILYGGESLYTLNSVEDFDHFVRYIYKYGYRLERTNMSISEWHGGVAAVSYTFVKQMQILLLRGKLDDCLVYRDSYSGFDWIVLMPCYRSNKWIVL